jgi:transcriptional regulator with XRE-family HTH domain
MLIGDRLRQLRESKLWSQGDIEKRTGLLRCYSSRVENGHTVPNIETLEKLASAFDVPLWKIFYEGDQPAAPLLPSREPQHSTTESVKDRKFYLKLARLLGRMTEKDRRLLFYAVQKMARRGGMLHGKKGR